MRIGKKLLAALLSLLLFVELMPLQVFAVSATDDTASEIEAVDGSYEETTSTHEIIGEAEEYRDADTKHFLNTDGSYTAVKYAQPVHYRTTADGEWQDIDNTLILTDAENAPGVCHARQAGSKAFGQDVTQVYVPQSSPVDVVLAKNSGEAYLATLNSGTHTLSWRYDVMERSDAQPEALASSDARAITFDSDADADESVQTRAVRNVTRGLVYSNVAADVDLEYILDSLHLKENIVLKAPTAPNSFRLTYAVGSLKAQQVSEQEIALRDSDGETVFTLYAPCMVDANMATSGCVTLKILSEQDGELEVQLTADGSWLQDPSRGYPVKIDPYVLEGTKYSAGDATFASKPHSSPIDSGTLGVGYDGNGHIGVARSFIKFDLPDLLPGDVITNAKLVLTQFSPGYSGEHSSMIVNAYQVLEDWTANTILYTSNYSDLPAIGSAIVDYKEVSAHSEYTTVSFDVTKLAKEWAESEQCFGICLKSANETNQDYAKFIRSTNNMAYRPHLAITYLNSRGLEGRWTNHTQSLGHSGASYINDYTGNLVFIAPLVSTTGNRMPVSVSLVYNGFQHGQDVDRPATVGKGWRLNIQEKLIPITSSGSALWATLYTKDYRYIYEDGDGTQHYFKLKNDYTTICEDEEGMGLTLTVNSTVTDLEKYVITADTGGKMTFTANGNLRKVYDTDNNFYKVFYHDDGRVARVEDGVGRKITFTYDTESGHTNRIVSVKDPSNRLTTFTYSSYDNLRAITHPDGTTTGFMYETPDYRMTRATGRDGGSLRYTYSDSGDAAVKNRVASVTEYSNSTTPTAGNSMTMDYSTMNRTKFTDNQNRVEIYQFDNSGRTVGIRDAAGNLGVYQYVSGTEENNKTANALKSASVGRKYVNNILRNHSFERTGAAWSPSPSGAQVATDYHYLGEKSVKLTGSGAYATQTRDVLSGYSYYTFSAYVRTDAATTDAAVSMKFMDDDNNSLGIITSNPVDYVTDWQRISVSGKIPTGTTKIRVRCMTGGAGNAWFDCAQLETGLSVNAYNLVENGSFNDSGVNVWSTEGTSGSDGLKWSDSDGYYKLYGSSSVEKRVVQTVPINRVGYKTFLTIRAKAKGTSVPLSGGGRRFGIGILAHYEDGTVGSVRWGSFNADYSADWQYTARTAGFQTDKVITYVEVICAYDKNANSASFNDVQVNLDETGVTYTYDSNGNLISAKDNAKRNQSYTYSNANEMTGANTADNKKYTFTYDEDNKHRITGATSAVEKDSNGNLTTPKLKFSFTYDSYGNVTSSKVTKYNGQQNIKQTTTYTEDGNYIAAAYTDRGWATTYDYDATKGTLNSVTDPEDRSTYYTYDAGNDRLLTVSNSSSASSSSATTVTYGYNSRGYLSSLTTPSTEYSLTYDSFGNAMKTMAGDYTLVENTYAANNGNLTATTYGNGFTVGYGYDNLDRVTSRKYNGTTKFYWAYNADGQVGWHQDIVNGKTYSYTYDDLGRPLRMDVSDGSWIQYGFNTVDQSTKLKYRYNDLTHTVSYGYAGADNLPSTTSFASAGKVTNDYDNLNRLKKKTYQTPESVADVTASYFYQDWESDANRTTSTVRGIDYEYDRGLLTMPALYYTYDKSGNITAENV